MNKYELCVVVSARIEEEERVSTLNKVKELVEKFGGQISGVDEWGKKRLAYEIQKMREGYFNFIHFEAESTAPAEIESRIRIMDNVLRFLCVREGD
jgi:small subunit ribosomal protein S6